LSLYIAIPIIIATATFNPSVFGVDDWSRLVTILIYDYFVPISWSYNSVF